MASLTRWTWVWVNSGSWWWTGRPGVLQFLGSQRVGHDWVTELNWTELNAGFPDNSGGKESTYNAGDPSPVPAWGRSTGEGIGYPPQYSWASLVAQLVKNPPAMWETWVQSLGWEDPVEKGTATHSSILAWRIPWSMGSQRVGYDETMFTFTSKVKPCLYIIFLKYVIFYSVLCTYYSGVFQSSIFLWRNRSIGIFPLGLPSIFCPKYYFSFSII